MGDLPSGNPHPGVHNPFYPFSMPDRRRAPTEREGGPVLRRVIGAAPVSRPAKTQRITELYSPGERCLVDPVELGRSIVLTVALPAFAVGCLVGMLL